MILGGFEKSATPYPTAAIGTEGPGKIRDVCEAQQTLVGARCFDLCQLKDAGSFLVKQKKHGNSKPLSIFHGLCVWVTLGQQKDLFKVKMYSNTEFTPRKFSHLETNYLNGSGSSIIASTCKNAEVDLTKTGVSCHEKSTQLPKTRTIFSKV